jgi:4-diphosphocytidyl-2-C-methyl-D-erythritol kinase
VSDTEFAPAKVNLFLHVGHPGPDGRHPVGSLAAFADAADVVRAERADRFSLTVEGPFAGDTGPVGDNLVSRALALAGAPPMAVHLTKTLPAASGLGGGSSDAGAALRLARRLFPDIGEPRIEAAARSIGADGPLCLRARAAVATGDGDVLSDPPVFPDLTAVLINPGAPSPTGAVYRAYDDNPRRDGEALPAMPAAFEGADAFIDFLATCRNDLEAPAVGLEPRIADVLAWLRSRPDVRLARMSGSGATCFALCGDDGAARRLADDAQAGRPDWWVRSCRLKGFGQDG